MTAVTNRNGARSRGSPSNRVQTTLKTSCMGSARHQVLRLHDMQKGIWVRRPRSRLADGRYRERQVYPSMVRLQGRISCLFRVSCLEVEARDTF